jgi:hypothetical protein
LLGGRKVVGVLIDTKEKVGPYPLSGHADQALFVDGYLWLLHRDTSCLTRLDVAREAEVGPGVPVGPLAMRMRYADGQILVMDFVDGSILKVDPDRVGASRKPIDAVTGGRLVDADQRGDSLVGIDAGGGSLVTLSAAVQDARERPHGFAAGAKCRP